MQQIFSAIALLPPFLIFISIILVILPTIIAILLRYSLYRHLRDLEHSLRRLLSGASQEEAPRIVRKLQQRFQQTNSNFEQVNTTAIIGGAYSQEKFDWFGLSLNCESVNYFSRILPNLLLAFGLLGTFLGITINLANLSQTITQIDITDVASLVGQLNQPLRGMGIAFISSLIAIACSALLTVINLQWNTSTTRLALLNLLEDYIDNIFLPQLQPPHPLSEAIDRFNRDFGTLLHKLGYTIEEAITNSFSRIEHSANIFQQAASTLEQSRFPEKLSSATTDLAIAQNQFSQSSLVLQKSTQSFEYTLDSMQKLSRKFIEMSEEITSINQKYTTLIELNKRKNVTEEASLKEIKAELARLVAQMKGM
ncbi:methyl-accepting chemotaxis protein [Pleurocapsales cyanobacterium LEGE 06147]|nr:methyl-accepting chemotaxis protein [Pleurocapsales cyanobacterium LEGE 06147]